MADEQSLQNTSFFSLIPQEWIDDRSFNTAVVRCYASAIADDPGLADIAATALRSFQAMIPGRSLAFLGTIKEDQQVLSFEMRPAFRDGTVHLSVGQKTVSVLAGGYVFLVSPLSVSDDRTDEDLINRRTDFIRGLLTGIFGHMAMLKLVFEHRYELGSPDKVSCVSTSFENHISPANWIAFSNNELIYAGVSVAAGESEFRDRLELSLSFIGRAANELDHVIRFSHIWIALEIAAGGHAAAKNFLNGLHNFAHEAKRFADIRNGLFHHGRRPVFDQNDERLLCTCVIARNLQNFGIQHASFSQLVTDHLARHPAP